MRRLRCWSDALSFLASALCITGMRPPRSAGPAAGQGVLAEVREGVTLIYANRLVRAIWAMVASYSFFAGFHFAVQGYWMIESLDLSPSVYGAILGMGGIGAVLGSLISGLVIRRLGVGRAIVVTYFGAALLTFMTPLAGFAPEYAVIFLLADFGVADIFWIVHNVGTMSLRQAAVTTEHLGRVNACFITGGRGMLTLGALAGGVLATLIGVQAVLFLASAGIVASGSWLLASCLWRITDVDAVDTASET